MIVSKPIQENFIFVSPDHTNRPIKIMESSIKVSNEAVLLEVTFASSLT